MPVIRKNPKDPKNFFNGNVFLLSPVDESRSILINEASMLKENANYVVSLEMNSGTVYKEIFIHNLGWIIR